MAPMQQLVTTILALADDYAAHGRWADAMRILTVGVELVSDETIWADPVQTADLPPISR